MTLSQRSRAVFLVTVALLAVIFPKVTYSQWSGRVYLPKETFAPGEPIFVYFEVTNTSSQKQDLASSDPYSPCSPYRIQVSSDPSSGGTCSRPILMSCLSSQKSVKPGQTSMVAVLLNYAHDVNGPGDYQVDAKILLPVTPDNSGPLSNDDGIPLQAHLWFRVDAAVALSPTAFTPWLAQLKSSNFIERQEAARVLASVAPASLEDTLLAFADDPDLREFAPLAFHRLNTEVSLAAMAALLQKSEKGTYESVMSAEYLSDTGDAQWFPLLLRTARASRIASYYSDAAALGKEDILPIAVAMIRSSDNEFMRPVGVQVLADTGSRAAVPILLQLLQGPDVGISLNALYGLRQLTHHDIGGDKWFENPQSQYSAWSSWWNQEGASATIYGPKECADSTPLK